MIRYLKALFKMLKVKCNNTIRHICKNKKELNLELVLNNYNLKNNGKKITSLITQKINIVILLIQYK